MREHARRQLTTLPEALRGLDPAPPLQATVAEPLRALAQWVDRRHAGAAA